MREVGFEPETNGDVSRNPLLFPQYEPAILNRTRRIETLEVTSMKTRLLYFAYGSNMKTSRLQKRIVSVKPVGRGKIPGKTLVCDKKSDDGSTKANLEDSPENVVWGVLYEIDRKDLEKLDKIEGGYERKTARIQTDDGGIVEAEIYISARIDKKELPFDWYKDLMIDGAQKHQLPQEYIEFLKGLSSKRSSATTRH